MKSTIRALFFAATVISTLHADDSRTRLQKIYVPGLAATDAEIYTFSIPGSSKSTNIRLPPGLKLANSSEELKLKADLINGMENSKLGKLKVYEILSPNWKNKLALPLFCIGTLPSSEKLQGRIPIDLWMNLRRSCQEYMDNNATSFRQQLISYGIPDPDIQLKDMLSPEENSVIIAGIFASADPQTQPSLLVARKAVFTDNSILIFEVAVDASEANCFQKLFYSIYTTDAR